MKRIRETDSGEFVIPAIPEKTEGFSLKRSDRSDGIQERRVPVWMRAYVRGHDELFPPKFGEKLLGLGPFHSRSRLVVCLLILCCFLASSARAAEPIQLNLWNIPPSWCWDPERKSQYKIFRRFLDLNPDIEVQQGQGLVILGPASQSSFLMAMAGGIAPDCFPTSLGSLPGYVEQGLVMPLDSFYEDWKDRERVPRMFIDAATIDRKLYGVVVNTGALGLIYRKDFFEDVGLDPDRPPENWEEFIEYSAKLTDPDQGRFGFGCRPEQVFINFLWQAGGELVRKGPNGTLEGALDTPEAAAALRFLQRLKFEGHMRIPTHAFAAANDMAEGKVAMVFARPETDYQYLLSKLQEYQLGITALPAGPAGRVTAVGGEAWCINGTLDPKNPEHRRRIEAAWRYISFLASREAARIRTQTYVERNGAQFLSPADLREFGFEYAVERIDPSLRDLHENIYKYGRVEPVFPGITEVGVIMRAPLEAVLANPNADPAEEMKKCNERINREVFQRRRGKADVIKERIATGVAVLLGIIFVFFFIKALRAISEKVKSETRVIDVGGKSMRRRKHTVAWLLMLPALASIALWSYFPLARGSLMAFQDYLLVGGGDYTGLKNFIDVFTNPMFYNVLFNTFYYVVLTLAIGFGVPIFLAILLAEVPRGKILFRVLFFLPAVTSGLVILFLWRWFYDPTEAGLFNTLLMEAGLISDPIGWLQDKRIAMICIILPGVWAGAGPGSIIYIAALKSVPNEVYEAADVDGAGTIRKVTHITLPYLKALIIINFVGAFIGSFHAMQNIFVMTGGGPENSTYTIGLDIYYNAFVYLRFGYATALAWVLGSMLIGFTMYQLRILKNVKFEAAKGE